MTFTPENIFFLGAVLIFASIVISKWGYRFGVPTLLLFLFTGMLFGSDGLGLEFHSHEDAQLIGMLSLSVILFSGGMDTKRRDIEPVATQGLMLSTVGVLITTGITRVSLSSHSRKHFLKSQIITQRSKGYGGSLLLRKGHLKVTNKRKSTYEFLASA